MRVELNHIYNEDCLKTLSRMGEGLVDMVLTSPPYDNLRKYNGYYFHFKHIARHLFRVTKYGGVVVWNVSDATINGSETLSSFKQALFFVECGFRLHDTMIFRKENFAPKTHRRYEQSFEYVFIFSKGSQKTFNPIKVKCLTAGDSLNWARKGSNIKEGVFRRRDDVITVSDEKIKENVWTYPCGATQTGHPAPFPVQFAADHINSWSNEGELIYDPFGGSGTTGYVASKLNRNWILSEISKEYCELASNRIYTAQLKAF